MRIISSFKDYYDGVIMSSYSKDDSMIWLRQEEPINVNKSSILKQFCGRWSIWPNKYQIEISVVGFCGKIYTLFSTKQITFGSLDEALDFLYTHQLSKQDKKKYFLSLAVSAREQNRLLVEDINKAKNVFDELFLKYNTPYFVISVMDYGKSLTINYNSLKKIGFSRLVDSFQAAQEIEMFFNSVLVKNKENPPQIMDDKTLVIAKGFDLKTSFRHPVK